MERYDEFMEKVASFLGEAPPNHINRETPETLKAHADAMSRRAKLLAKYPEYEHLMEEAPKPYAKEEYDIPHWKNTLGAGLGGAAAGAVLGGLIGSPGGLRDAGIGAATGAAILGVPLAFWKRHYDKQMADEDKRRKHYMENVNWANNEFGDSLPESRLARAKNV